MASVLSSSPGACSCLPETCARTASAIAIAITQSSWEPAVAAEVPSALRTQMREDAITVVVTLDGEQRIAVLTAKITQAAGKLQRGEVAVKLGALHAGVTSNDFGAGVVAFASTSGGIDADNVLLGRLCRKPDAEPTVVEALERLAAVLHGMFDNFRVEDTFTRGEEAGLGIFGILLYGQGAKTRGNVAAVQDLRWRQSMHVNHALLVGSEQSQLVFCIFNRAAIGLFEPPGEEVAGVAGLFGPLPFLIKDTAGATRCRFENDLAERWDGGTKRRECFESTAGPAGHFRAVQVLDSEPASGVFIRRCGHAVFAVEPREHNLADVGARYNECSRLRRAGQVLPEAVHDAKNLFCRLLIVGDLDGEAARVRDCFDEKAGCDVGRHAKLARFKDDVLQ